jgi:hypothetical protein
MPSSFSSNYLTLYVFLIRTLEIYALVTAYNAQQAIPRGSRLIGLSRQQKGDYMQKQIRYDRWFLIDTSEGTVAIPQDYIGKTLQITASDVEDYIHGNFLGFEVVDGYGARLSMLGYLDCTEWTVFKTEEEADQYLCDLEG